MKKKEFRIYAMETSCFFPWSYKTIEGKEREKLLEKFEKEIKEEIKEEGSKVKGGLAYWIRYYMLLE